MSTETITVKILDKEYQVACPADEQNNLLQAAQHLDKQMRGVRTAGKVVGLERIAVMVALNVTYEMLQGRSGSASSESEKSALGRINGKIDETLHRCRQLEIS